MTVSVFRSVSCAALAAAAAVFAVLPCTGAQAAAYELTWLGDLPGGAEFSIARDVSDSGVVVGYSKIDAGLKGAFRWSAEEGLVQLGALEGGTYETAALSINGAGLVAGSSSSTRYREVVYWDAAGNPVSFHDAAGFGGVTSEGTAINDSGQVAGVTSLPGGGTGAFVWSAAEGARFLDSFGGTETHFVYDLTNAGQAVGVWETNESVFKAALWRADGATFSLGDALGNDGSSAAFSISDTGFVAGLLFRDGADRGFVWSESGGAQEIGTLVGGTGASYALGVNDAGVVVGAAFVPGGERAVIWSASAGIADLNDMISGGGMLVEARAISDIGYIVGYGVQDGTSYQQAFLLTPASLTSDVPLPAGLALLPAALAGFGLLRRRAA